MQSEGEEQDSVMIECETGKLVLVKVATILLCITWVALAAHASIDFLERLCLRTLGCELRPPPLPFPYLITKSPRGPFLWADGDTSTAAGCACVRSDLS